LRGVARYNHVGVRVIFQRSQGIFTDVKPHVGFSLSRIRPVAFETAVGKDRAYVQVEIDRIRLFGHPLVLPAPGKADEDGRHQDEGKLGQSHKNGSVPKLYILKNL
jgi:hypothetical protein